MLGCMNCSRLESNFLTSQSSLNRVTAVQAMGKIHAIRKDGGVVTNVEAFKQLYEAAGRGWVYSFAKIGPLKSAAEWCAHFEVACSVSCDHTCLFS